MNREQYWVSNTGREERKRVHIDREGGLTVCGRVVKKQGLSPISRIDMIKSKIPTCSRCIRILKSETYGHEDTSKYNKTKLGKVENMKKTKTDKPIKLPKKFDDEVTNPKLKKFKSIVSNAKQQRVAIENAIQKTIEVNEFQETNLEALTRMLGEVNSKLTNAISDAYNSWEADLNTANDCKHFCNITALRNLAQAIQAVEEL